MKFAFIQKKEIKMINKITTIAFDADDTLWVNESYFQEAEKQFCYLFEKDFSHEIVSKELFSTEMKNLTLYGYGIKGFMLCMIETANKLINKNVSSNVIKKIINIGHELLEKPIELLEGVEETLESLKSNYKLILATKGDLIDQERKLKKSGLEKYFDYIEIMSDKKINNYQKLLNHLGCQPENFLMLGNSIKSDIIPVLDLGGSAAHIPYHITWSHEEIEYDLDNEKFRQLKSIKEIKNILG